MRRDIRITEPSAEMQIKIRRACNAIATQKKRMVKCPYTFKGGSAIKNDRMTHDNTT